MLGKSCQMLTSFSELDKSKISNLSELDQNYLKRKVLAKKFPEELLLVHLICSSADEVREVQGVERRPASRCAALRPARHGRVDLGEERAVDPLELRHCLGTALNSYH